MGLYITIVYLAMAVNVRRNDELIHSSIRSEALKMKKFILLFVFSIFLFQLLLLGIQVSRYRFDPESDDNYCCVEMSRDVEAFFEGVLGIHVLQVRGYNTECNEVFIEGHDEPFITYVQKGIGHRWVILDFGLFEIPYESTCLLPINPQWFHTFDNLWISEGYYDGSAKVAKETEDLVFELDV